MSHVVPQADDRFVTPVVLEPEHADAGRAAEEKPPGAWRQPEPTGRDHPDDVGAGERQDVPADVLYPGDEAVGPGGDVVRGFPAGAAVAEEFPARPLLQNVPGLPPLEAAVVPLHQVGIDLRYLP